MKKLLALLLAMFMLFSLVACNKDKAKVDEKPADDAVVDEDVPEEEVVEEEVVEEEVVEDEDVADDAEVVDEEDADEGENLGYEDPEEYTYQDYLSVSPSNWNPFTWESGTDSEILNAVTSSLWGFDFDHEHPAFGYTIKLDMAAEMPEDITQELKGDDKWGIPEDAEEGYAYRVKLLDYLKWEDGTPINTEDIIYSIKTLLEPKAQNLRADMLYNGGKIVVGAKAYLYQGQTVPVSLVEFVDFNDLESVEAYLEEHGEEMAKVNWANSFGEMYDAEKGEWVKEGFENAVVDAGVTINELHELFVEKVHGEWGESEETAEQFFQEETFVDYTYPEVDYDTVGIQAEDDLTFIIVFERPLTGFDFFWNFNGIDLVKKDLYEEYLTENDETGLLTSTYGSSVKNTTSYGPYKLVEFQDDKTFKFERNENWHGYHNDRNKGLYQTDKIVYTIVKEPATSLQMFLKGQLDGYNLTADQVEDFRGSDYIFFTLGSYTPCLNFTQNVEALEARQEPGLNKTVLSLKTFRKALVWSIDRADLAEQASASNLPGYGLLNSRYIADVDEVIPYREFEPAKETLVKFYGLEYGEGKEYADLEEAYEAMTGYDLDTARELFDEAYDEAIEKGLLKEGDKVSLDYYAGTDNEVVRKYYNYFKTAWEKAVKGTKFEGKFELNLDATAGNDFGKNFRNGLSDVMLAGWQGATFDPFYLIGAYIQEQYRYDAIFNVAKPVTVEVDGEEITLGIEEWYLALQGQDPDHKFGKTDADQLDRIKILAALEFAIMDEFTSCPVMYSSSAILKSQKVEFYTNDFNELMGYGAWFNYLTYNYTDAEWKEYLDEQGGELDYK